ncbi:DUF4258 domain-containing protein [Pseudanabaena sp. FACHB-1998]|uniref:DUF4258 domain-containing protein n=1 Tax=Pseudanabaena sp. FACHB-1998 TaxID=2692858 RepID=UPI00167FF606|nr:DUF4258 domain-containing protein [Pseudanabaena sp. FACHB-1998]MBD2175500.1 DUF4258 domain-containing protein [Pseudanabaena sp. FACHB-1998]
MSRNNQNDNTINLIKDKIQRRYYDISRFAMESAAQCGLTILDIEVAILNGEIINIEEDSKGEKYEIVGEDGLIIVEGRFSFAGKYMIFSVYTINVW